MEERATSRDSPGLYIRMHHTRKFLPRDCDVLETACGTGYVSEMLVKRGCRVTGFDYDRKAISAVRAKGRFTVSDFYDFRPGKRFDCVLCLETLEHLKDERKALRLMNRWLKPGGKLILSVPTCSITDEFRSTGHLRHYGDYGKLERLLKSCGFRVLRKKDWGCLWNKFFWGGIRKGTAGRRKDYLPLRVALKAVKPLLYMDALVNRPKCGVILECGKD
jgi:SAM-dependent methyltransferase